MTEPWSLLVLVVAVGAGLLTVTALSVLARSHRTALFRYLQVQILLFNLLILAGLVVQYLALPLGGGHAASSVTVVGLLAAMAPLKAAWLYAFIGMTLVLPGQELPLGFPRMFVAGAILVFCAGVIGAGASALAGAGTRGTATALAVFEALVIGGALVACLHLLARARTLPRGLRRRSVAILGGGYLVVFALMTGSLVLGWLRQPTPAESQIANGVLMIVCNLLPLAWVLRFQPRGPLSSSDALARYGITPREREIISLISAGSTNQEVADRLFISQATVKDHNYNIFRKMGVRNRVELVNLLRPDRRETGD